LPRLRVVVAEVPHAIIKGLPVASRAWSAPGIAAGARLARLV